MPRTLQRHVTVEHNGANLTLSALARATGIAFQCLYARYHDAGDRGEHLIRAVKQPRPKKDPSA